MIPEAVQRAQDNVSVISDEDENPYHDTLEIIRGLGIEAQRTGKEVGAQTEMLQQRDDFERVRALKADGIKQFDQGPTIEDELRKRKSAGNGLQPGMTQSREPEPVQRLFLESEKMRIVNAQAVDEQNSATQAPSFAAMGTAPEPQHQAQNLGPDAIISEEPQVSQTEPKRVKQIGRAHV